MSRFNLFLILLCFLFSPRPSYSQEQPKPYRLSSVDLKQQVIWLAKLQLADGTGLAFGGQDQDAEDGCYHTHVLKNGEWTSLYEQLKTDNPLQTYHESIWKERNDLKSILANVRRLYFKGLSKNEELKQLKSTYVTPIKELQTRLTDLVFQLSALQADKLTQEKSTFVAKRLGLLLNQVPEINKGIQAQDLSSLLVLQQELEILSDFLSPEPPPRAMDCGLARFSKGMMGSKSNTLVYHEQREKYYLFGGDHFDYLTNDLWEFDPKIPRWNLILTTNAPSPRANHRLSVMNNGKIKLAGGYTYSSSTGYLSGQYQDLNDGEYTFDFETGKWIGDKLTTTPSRVYRTGPLYPDYYYTESKPNAEEFESWLAQIPENEWVPTNPPKLPRLNRDWGTARIDTHRDLMLRWSGGHSAHGGTDVLHYHFLTNRWELTNPVEFPLGQLYSNTSYPNGFNFNLRPWMTGHTYQNYAFDPPSKLMVKTGRPRHSYLYDPDLGDWVGRSLKPKAMQYNSCFYTLTLTATPHGAYCWDKHGRVHKYDHEKKNWEEIELKGEKLPGAYVDHSTLVYDSNRDRLLILNTPGYNKPFNGQIWSVDLEDNTVRVLSPSGMSAATQFATIDKSCYDPVNDLIIIGTYFQEYDGHSPMPAYDCKTNQWIKLDIKYEVEQRSNWTIRKFPHRRSAGLMYDTKRNLIWGTDTNSQVYVLKLKR